MKNKSNRITEIEEGLRSLPERRPPADLQQKIMASLPSQQRKSWLRRVREGFHNLFKSYPQPVFAAAGVACLLITFYGGMQFDRLLQTPVLLHPEPPVVTEMMNADSSFYLGRSLLAAGNPKEALVAFRRAEQLGPKNPEYVLWQAASFYALGDTAKERQRYQQLIASRPDYLPARLNLAHNLLQGGEFEQAEQLYEKVLESDPLEKSALYNRGLVLHLQDKKGAEQAAWKIYLNHYRTGTRAHRALQHLHDGGDYSFRGYQLGYSRIIINQEYLLGDLGPERDGEIRYLSAQFARQPEDALDLVVFHQDDVELAREIALGLRREITGQLPANKKKKVRISWFGEAESIERFNQASTRLREGILIFSTPGSIQKGERI